MNLCIPCANRCRYCLLSYCGTPTGVEMKRSMEYADKFYHWLKDHRPDLSFLFGFGYSMDHPDILNIIKFCQRIGSVTGEFLQFDGMEFRSETQLITLLSELKQSGIKLIDLTFYGTEVYHDQFAARQGDYRLMMDTLRIANQVELDVAISIPLNHENFTQIDALLQELEQYRTTRISCFVPHSEGRGRLLNKVRLTIQDYNQLSDQIKMRFNRTRFKTEGEWIRETNIPLPTQRVLTLNLTPDNIEIFETKGFAETIKYLERLDDDYYQKIPSFPELIKRYGNPSGNFLYSSRDLYLCYQHRYIQEHQLDIYDINDERQCFSRRI